MRHVFCPLGLLLSLMLLGACSYVPFGAMMSLRQIDPLRAEAFGLRVAVVSPPGIALTERPALVLATIVPGRGREETRISFEKIVDAGSGLDVPGVMAGRETAVYRLDPLQAPRLKQFQDSVLAFKAAGVRGTAEVTVDVKSCQNGPDMSGDIDVFLRVASDGAYIRVLQGVPRRELMTSATSMTLAQECR